MKHRLKLTLAVLFLCSVVLAGGCGGGDELLPDGAPLADTTLKVVTMFGGEDPHSKVYYGVNYAFRKKYPNVTLIDNSAQSTQSWRENDVPRLFDRPETEPDVLYFFNGSATDHFKDQLVTVDTIRQTYPEYGAGFDMAGQIDRTALIFKGYSEGLLLNTDLISPAEAADFDTLLAKLSGYRDDPARRISLGVNIPHYVIEHILLKNLGVEGYCAIDGTAASVRAYEPQWMRALIELKAFFEAAGYGELDTEEQNAFLNGQRCARVDGSWFSGRILDPDACPDPSRFRVVPFPTGNDGVVAGWGHGWMITQRAWNDPARREAAVRFVEAHLYNVADYCAEAGGFPARPLEPDETDDGLMPAFRELIRGKQLCPASDGALGTSYRILVLGVDTMISGTQTPQEVYDQFIAALPAAIA